MKVHEATEAAYKNGYAKGYEEGKRDAVKHGRWEHLGGDEWCCTACGNVITTEGSWEKPTQKYCNECGADMRGEENCNSG